MPIQYWCLNEVLKSNRDKSKCKGMNKVLIMFGESGVGKTSFARYLLNPVFMTFNVEVGEYVYQHPQIADNRIKILVSPDDCKPDQLYTFAQVIQGEVSLQIKREHTPLNMAYKSGLVLTNIPEAELFNSANIGRQFGEQRLRRRSVFASIGNDMNLVKFIFGQSPKATSPPLAFRCFYFWHKVLRGVQSTELKRFAKQLDKPLKIKLGEYKNSLVKTYRESLTMQDCKQLAAETKKLYPDLSAKHQESEPGFAQDSS